MIQQGPRQDSPTVRHLAELWFRTATKARGSTYILHLSEGDMEAMRLALARRTAMNDIVERLREWRRGVRGQAVTPTDALMAEVTEEIERLREMCLHQNEEISQILGKALGYPWFKDDPQNFPDATECSGVCVGDHVAETLAEEIATRLKRAEAVIEAARSHIQYCTNTGSALELAKAIRQYDKERDDE